MKTYTIKYGST